MKFINNRMLSFVTIVTTGLSVNLIYDKIHKIQTIYNLESDLYSSKCKITDLEEKNNLYKQFIKNNNYEKNYEMFEKITNEELEKNSVRNGRYYSMC